MTKVLHELKTHDGPFQAIKMGQKTFEFRYNDRNYKPGDSVLLREYLPNLGKYTQDVIKANIGFCLYGPAFGVPENYVVFSILNIEITNADGPFRL